MASGWNSESDREAMLRRVAIVLSSLPTPLASQLLGSIGPESKRAIRQTMTTLEDVDPLERHRALQAFKLSVQQQPPRNAVSSMSRVNDSDTVETIAPTSKVVSSYDRAPGPAATSESASSVGQPIPSPLAFLADVEDAALVNLLAVEHPQAVALVLASIPPAQAARVLPRLDPRLQTESLSRIGRLGNIPEAAAAEVAEHFRQRLSQRATHADPTSLGRRALDAILAAMPPATPAAQPPSDTVPPPTPPSDPTAPQRVASPVTFPTADRPELDLTHKLRVAESTMPEHHPQKEQHATLIDAALGASSRAGRGEVDASPTGPAISHHSDIDHPAGSAAQPPFDPPDASSTPHADPLDSTDAIHQFLIRLTPHQLCRALGQVGTRDAMLTLCGLPNEVTEAAIAILPRGQARKVRIKMNSLGSLHLREIDDAKEKVARAATRARKQPSTQESMPAQKRTENPSPNQVPVAA